MKGEKGDVCLCYQRENNYQFILSSPRFALSLHHKTLEDMEKAHYQIFDFRPDSPDYVHMISSQAGIIPDYSEERLRSLRKQAAEEASVGEAAEEKLRVGIFADDMPQNIVTRVYNYGLDVVLLLGDESAVMIDNLQRTLDPDIRPGIRIVKAQSLEEAMEGFE